MFLVFGYRYKVEGGLDLREGQGRAFLETVNLRACYAPSH